MVHRLSRMCGCALVAFLPAMWTCGLAHARDEPLAIVQAAPVDASSGADAPWALHLQATWIRQAKPAFPAAYSGRNSLSPARESGYTFTSTAFVGMRPWRGGELWLNPELSQGVPLSGLVGLGGFTNGEATRVAGPEPTLYRQRLFVRHTWPLGGPAERVEAEANRLPGWQSRDRLVLTAGNFSLLDVFDGNAYARDPRTQFLNWSLMTHGAYDYAADARGFGWGLVLEWIRGDWALRAGRMTPPRDPNGQRLDFRFFRHYGDQIELERNWRVGERAGAARLLLFRNRAVLSRYADALAARADGPPDMLAMRTGARSKTGVGINLEQDFGGGVGGFLRAMRADGRTETLSFTEVDRSLALGLSIDGALWTRPDDAVGLAFARNALSRDRRDYLGAGGISYFIGDGGLRYRAETLVEAYYRAAIARGAWATLDWQRIRNPAYNADRGPVDVLSVRLHLEY